MPRNPKVSVLMPVYNGEEYIREAIDSVLSQTLRDFELIIINDGSTDNSIQIIKSYSDPRIVLVNSATNSGVIATLNKGIDAARGDYIARLDADDIAMPERFEKQVDFLDSHQDYGFYGSSATIIDQAGNKLQDWIYTYEAPTLPSHLLFRNVFIHSSIMVRAAILKVLPYHADYYVAEDYFSWVKVAADWKMYNSPECLVKHRVHRTNITKLKREQMERTIDNIYRYQLNLLGIEPTDEELIIHRKAGNYVFEHSVDFLTQTYHWLNKLLKANNQRKKYEPQYFNSVLADIWFNTVSFNHELGWSALNLFNTSPLTPYLPKNLRRKIRLLCLLHTPVVGLPLKPLYFMFKKVG